MTFVHINIILNQDTVMLSKTMTLFNASCFIHSIPLRLRFWNGIMVQVCEHTNSSWGWTAAAALLGQPSWGQERSVPSGAQIPSLTPGSQTRGASLTASNTTSTMKGAGEKNKMDGFCYGLDYVSPQTPLPQKIICMLKP